MKDGEKVLESFKIFPQVNSRLTELVVGFGPKGMPGKSEVILCQLLRSLNFRFVETEIRKKRVSMPIHKIYYRVFK